MSGFRDGLRLRLSDPTSGSGPQNGPPGSLGFEDSEEEGLDPQRGVSGDLNTWNWNRSAPVSTSYAISTAEVMPGGGFEVATVSSSVIVYSAG